jgi:release factor glutamine methyltransferase
MHETIAGADGGRLPEPPVYYQIYKSVCDALNLCGAFNAAAAEAEARIILENAAGVNFSKIMGTMWRDEVEEGVRGRVNDILKLRAAGVPVQYIFGEAEFFGLTFKVSEAVLIPRHDTECVVEAVIKHAAGALKAPGAPPVLRVLDIGTGSGAIAVSVALAFKGGIKVTAVDLSPGALGCAAANALALGASDYIEFIESDIYTAADPAAKFDIIVSNPPYISRAEYAVLPREVRKEPEMALVAECGGYEFYEKIMRDAHLFLNGGGAVFFETGYKMAEGVIKIASAYGFKNYEMINDIESRNRGVKLWQ